MRINGPLTLLAQSHQCRPVGATEAVFFSWTLWPARISRRPFSRAWFWPTTRAPARMSMRLGWELVESAVPLLLLLLPNVILDSRHELIQRCNLDATLSTAHNAVSACRAVDRERARTAARALEDIFVFALGHGGFPEQAREGEAHWIAQVSRSAD